MQNISSESSSPSNPEGSWSAAIVNHGDYDELEACLRSIAEQQRPPRRVCVYDTGIDPARLADLCKAFPDVEFEMGPNLGYAGGANRLLSTLASGSGAAELFLLLNSDIILDADFAARLADAIVSRPEVAIAGGKLLRPGRVLLDSTGIDFPRHRRPRDRGSEEVDAGRFDRAERVDGVSGAAMMLRADALDALAIEDEVFDRDFFAYHEDTDLCWRARRLGWSIWYEPSATAVHRRGWRRSDRFRVPIEIRRHSFKNHYLQIAKNERGVDLLLNLPWLLGWELLRLGFVLTRDRALLGGYVDALHGMRPALRKRRAMRSMARRSDSETSSTGGGG